MGLPVRFTFRGSAAHVFDVETGHNLEYPQKAEPEEEAPPAAPAPQDAPPADQPAEEAAAPVEVSAGEDPAPVEQPETEMPVLAGSADIGDPFAEE